MHGAKSVVCRIKSVVRRICTEAAGPPPPRSAWFHECPGNHVAVRNHVAHDGLAAEDVLADKEERRRDIEA